ncbi:DNA uptake protein [Bacillus cereus]|uniref:helix-hairpin-helix domain-containing protein n=1 Tax=Bacillus cereus TaxID=1396 RepID=UPI000BFA0508|nr:helix-hairpin-helix domain-containing protein [Bacillus cereus]PEQ53055.1 DNA uptake protein [Bacillus cereus]PFD68888.1 DNA uptake protein [Bacillus cereus]PFV05432.1 DNA uptake protein [Bacillus cereus]PGV45093.1 DNA uptake protein [Bacillus cereus]
MGTKMKNDAIKLLEESLEQLENQKGSVLTGVQKLARASKILEDEDTVIWCEIQLGNKQYTKDLKKALEFLVKISKEGKPLSEVSKEYKRILKELGENGYNPKVHFSPEEVNIKRDEAGGAYQGIGFIEERYNDFVRLKQGGNGTYYKNNLITHISHIKREAHEKATTLYTKTAYTDSARTAFDILKNEVDDKLLDLNPELAEQLMLAFKSVSTDNPEEWSQALTTCRRFIEGLADELFPPIDEEIDGRKLGKTQYINRLWAFMDKSIESKSNKDLAKAHVDILGVYLQRIHKLSNKGVHAGLEREEAVKTVFHTYLMVADILKYLDPSYPTKKEQLNIHKASLDELESLLGVPRSIAKEIVKVRVREGEITPEILGKIKGVGSKTISLAQEEFSFEPIA